jgi:predicted dehydrogenase
MSEPIRVGLVGLGRAGNGMHKKELGSRQDKFRFYAVCDIIEERTVPFVEEFGSKPYTRYEDMLADPQVELVDIATRSCDHFLHAKMALLAGKDVMLEKPFCMRKSEVDELIALGSQPAGPHLYVRHNRRFENGFVKAMEIIESGKLDKTGLYHYSNEGTASWYDLAKEINDMLGYTCNVEPCRTSEFPVKAMRPCYSVMDKKKVKETFGIEIPHWRESLAMLVEEYETNGL